MKFFHINEETIRNLREQAQAKAKETNEDTESKSGRRLYMSQDGSVFIEDPTLIKLVPTDADNTEPTQEDIEKMSYRTPFGWVELSKHPEFQKTKN